MLELTNIQKDMFNEIGNVGVGNAATALSSMIGDKKINISLPNTEIVNKEDIIKDSGSDVLLVDCKIEGDLVGNFVVIYNRDTAFPLIDLLLSQPKGTLKEIDEMAKSVFKEMVNVIAGPYLDSLANMADLKLLPQPPTFVYGKLFSIKDIILAKLPQDIDDVISVKTELSVEKEVIFGNIYFVLNKLSLDKLLNLLSCEK